MGTTADKLNGILNAKNAIKTAIENKGITVGDAKFSEYASKIDSITQSVSGTDVSDTTAEQSDVIYGKTFHKSDGSTATGSLDIDASKIMYGKTIGNVSGTATQYDSAYAGDILNGRQAHARGQSITGTIPLKGGQTYTPTSSNQTISSGSYLSGDQVILGDANLKPQNIKWGVTIFGVTGTYVALQTFNDSSSSVNYETFDDLL